MWSTFSKQSSHSIGIVAIDFGMIERISHDGSMEPSKQGIDLDWLWLDGIGIGMLDDISMSVW